MRWMRLQCVRLERGVPEVCMQLEWVPRRSSDREMMSHLRRRLVELEKALAEAKKGGMDNKGGGKNNKGG